jgi:FkbM family methyltransferase
LRYQLVKGIHAKILEMRKNPIIFVMGQILYFTKLCQYVTFRKGNLLFRFYPASTLSCLWLDRSWYDKDLAFFRAFLKPRDVFVDVGANVGLMSLTAADIVGKQGVVISIEGFPKTYYYLKNLIELNGFSNMKSYNYIIGSQSTFASFVENSDDTQNYIYVDEKGKIPVRRLDDIIGFLDHINLLKIDVEGYEKFVLFGATGILDRVNTIFFEMSKIQYSRYNYGLDEIIAFLEKFGFKVFRLSNIEIHQIERGYIGNFENLIATKDLQNLLKRTNYRMSNGN